MTHKTVVYAIFLTQIGVYKHLCCMILCINIRKPFNLGQNVHSATQPYTIQCTETQIDLWTKGVFQHNNEFEHCSLNNKTELQSTSFDITYTPQNWNTQCKVYIIFVKWECKWSLIFVRHKLYVDWPRGTSNLTKKKQCWIRNVSGNFSEQVTWDIFLSNKM